jgi:hypothetical protein
MMNMKNFMQAALLTVGWAPKVFYCPAPSSGPATCKEAKMVPLAAK